MNMLKVKVGTVTEQEKNEIMQLYERKNALKELYITLSSPYVTDEERKLLKESLIEDLTKTHSRFESWWRTSQEKYNWKTDENGHFVISFDTREIFLEMSVEHGCVSEKRISG